MGQGEWGNPATVTPQLSTTNKVSTLFPILEQLKLYFDKVKIRLFVQSSLDPLLIWLAVTVALPLASRVTVWLSFAIAIVISLNINLRCEIDTWKEQVKFFVHDLI